MNIITKAGSTQKLRRSEILLSPRAKFITYSSVWGGKEAAKNDKKKDCQRYSKPNQTINKRD